MKENKLLTKHHGLLLQILNREGKNLESLFLGKVLHHPDEVQVLHPKCILYLAGNVREWMIHPYVRGHPKRFIIKELSTEFENEHDPIVSVDQVPRNVHNVGLFVPRLVPHEAGFFERIVEEHKPFQHLKLGNKPGVAYRTGAYITAVTEQKDKFLEFHLLRCSSNFSGPTHNTTATDQCILQQVNKVANENFEQSVELNHVLAQIYHNQTIVAEDGTKKDKKAVIASHSDKTKDMPQNGLIAFFTLYQGLTCKKSTIDKYDHVYKDQSVLTTLRFVLKVPNEHLVSGFEVTLYPGSLFVMSRGTNREYTHEIVPSILPVEHLPTRMGYVIRCSKTKAIAHHDTVHIVGPDNSLVPLQPSTSEKTALLKELYACENRTNALVEYPFVDFSMNKGDYMSPVI